MPADASDHDCISWYMCQIIESSVCVECVLCKSILNYFYIFLADCDSNRLFGIKKVTYVSK